jgi:hypothetical protein
MAQALDRTKASPVVEIDPSKGHRIIDVVEVKTAYGAPAPGFILVVAGFRPAPPEALIGEVVVIEPPGGWAILGKIADTRDHGPTISVLVENWPVDFPPPLVGWSLRVPAFEGPDVTVNQAGEVDSRSKIA